MSAPQAELDLFVYGSLMFEPVWNRIVKRDVPGLPAILGEYVRLSVVGETYPGIVARPSAQVPGVLRLGVRAAEVAWLDAFEGEEYVRTAVQVREGKTLRPAHAYVFVAAHRLDTQPWDVDAFASTGIAQFMSRYGGFDR